MTLSLTQIGETTTPVPPSLSPSGKKRGVDQYASVDSADSMLGHLRCEIIDRSQWIAWHDLGARTRCVAVVFVLERERAIRLQSTREIGVAA